MIHGLTFPSVVWKLITPQLAKEGMRILVYGKFPFLFLLAYAQANLNAFLISNTFLDLYGRGYSDAPPTTYDAELYTTQLALLMQHVKWERAHIVGFSMVRTRFSSLLIGLK